MEGGGFFQRWMQKDKAGGGDLMRLRRVRLAPWHKSGDQDDAIRTDDELDAALKKGEEIGKKMTLGFEVQLNEFNMVQVKHEIHSIYKVARELDDGHSSKAKLQHVMAAMSFGGTVKQFAQQYAIACCDDSATWTGGTGTPWVELDGETYTLEQIQAAYVFAHIDKSQEGTISKHELTEFLTDPNVVFPQVSFGESEYKSPEDVFAKIVSFRRKGLKFDTKGNCISGDCEGGITPKSGFPATCRVMSTV